MSGFLYKKGELKELIKLAQNSDYKALEEVIRRVQKNVYTIFSHLVHKKEDISDLTQEALIKMSKNIYTLEDIKSFKSWLNRIITNIFYDYLRKQKPLAEDNSEEILLNLKDEIGCEPGEKCLFSELEKIIRAAMLGLPQNLRITIVLREFEGLSYENIAQITNVSLGTVKSRISRARTILQENLKEFI